MRDAGLLIRISTSETPREFGRGGPPIPPGIRNIERYRRRQSARSRRMSAARASPSSRRMSQMTTLAPSLAKQARLRPRPLNARLPPVTTATRTLEQPKNLPPSNEMSWRGCATYFFGKTMAAVLVLLDHSDDHPLGWEAPALTGREPVIVLSGPRLPRTWSYRPIALRMASLSVRHRKLVCDRDRIR